MLGLFPFLALSSGKQGLYLHNVFHTEDIMIVLTTICLFGAALGTLVGLVLHFRREIAAFSDKFCALPPLTKFVAVAALCIAVTYGGSKTNQVDQTSGTNDVEITDGDGLTNLLMGAFGLTGSPNLLCTTMTSDYDLPPPTVTDEDIARGWQCMGPQTNDDVSYTMPENAAFATNWWMRGAYEDVAKIGLESLGGLGGLERYDSMWAFTWGKVRFALNDTNEIVAVGAPMSAVPFRSRLWSAMDTNEAFRIAWEDFALGRIEGSRLCPSGETPLPLCCAQIEFRANGDYVTRSNNVETVWRRIDPDDIDGDGYLNDDDACPYDWDEGADEFYGPCNDLPDGCNEDAYCNVTVEVDDQRSQWVTFTGDGYSNYSDPQFYAKPGIPYDVKILIGKTYRVTCDAPIRAVGRSDDEIVISDISNNAFTVVWPVTITEMPRLFAAPPRGLLGGSHGNTGFTLDVVPSWLDGDFYWATNACCQVVENDGWWSFTCEEYCTCGGCMLSGNYLYEGYKIFFSGIGCGCQYTPHTQTSFGLDAPPVVFKDGALKPLTIRFHHGDPSDPEEGELTLEVSRGSDKIQIWEDGEKTSAVSTLNWDASSFEGLTLYIEGVDASSSVGDIEFKLTWARPGGDDEDCVATTTCAEVEQTNVSSPTAGITDGSTNQQPFDGNTSWNFDVTQSPNPDKHFSVLFSDVAGDNFSVRDFSVDMTLVVKPTGAPVGTASWFALDPLPPSGTIVSTGPLVGTLCNPKVGGVYHIGSCFSGSPTNECNIVLPLAGASVDDILREDLAYADTFASRARAVFSEKQINTIQFGLYFFWDAGRGDYLGRPDNVDRPTVWAYNQVVTSGRQFGKGAVATLSGVPIRISKLSNLLAAYTCERLGVYQELQILSQWIGTRNDDSSRISWDYGTHLAHGSNYVHSVSNMVRGCWSTSDSKAIKLWPNPAPADNHAESVLYSDVERFFYSPGMLYSIQR